MPKCIGRTCLFCCMIFAILRFHLDAFENLLHGTGFRIDPFLCQADQAGQKAGDQEVDDCRKDQGEEGLIGTCSHQIGNLC